MKKTYMTPTARVFALHARQQLLTMSGEISGYSKSGSGFSQDESSVKRQGSYNVWDEDWSQ